VIEKRSSDAIAVGVDVGGTLVKASLVGVGGELQATFQQDSPRTPTALRDFILSVRRHSDRPVIGIGIGCKGIIDPTTTRVNSLPGHLHFLEGLLLSEVAEADGLPVCADNDARAALVAEVLWGSARGRQNVVLLTLGTGVGGAALVNGMILRGFSGAAGHFGHMTIDTHGGLCICGNHGCLETCFSSRAIESDYAAHIHRASPTLLRLGADGRVPNTEAIFRAASDGDPSARRVLDLAFEALTASIVSVLHIFDPELLILGGNIAAAGGQLRGPLQDEVERRTRVLLQRKVPIVLQTAIGYGGVAGAAGLVFLQERLLTI
jgi:glucokinase